MTQGVEVVFFYYATSRVAFLALLAGMVIESAQDRRLTLGDVVVLGAMAIWFAIPPVAEAWLIGFAAWTAWSARETA